MARKLKIMENQVSSVITEKSGRSPTFLWMKPVLLQIQFFR